MWIVRKKMDISLVPVEVIYNILIDLCYADTVNYCSTNRDAKKICDDDMFWKQKLDRKYSSELVNGKKPSDYAKYLNHRTRYRNIYREWELGAAMLFTDVIDTDVIDANLIDTNLRIADFIMFKLDTGFMNGNNVTLIIWTIASSGSEQAFDELVSRTHIIFFGP